MEPHVDASRVPKLYTSLEINGSTEIQLTCDVNGLRFSGSQPFSLDIRGSRIVIKSQGGGTSTSTISCSGGSVFIQNSIGGGNSRIIVNGKDITDIVNNTIGEKEKEDDIYKRVHTVSGVGQFTEIKLIGGGGIYVNTVDVLDHNTLSLLLQGAGDVKLCDKTHLKVLSLALTGSGDISCGDCTVDSLTASLTGSGDIDSVIVRQNGILNLVGSGDVRVSALSSATVMENKVGSGDIEVKRV